MLWHMEVDKMHEQSWKLLVFFSYKTIVFIFKPNDLINLIREWLRNRSYYVQVGEECSVLFDSETGTIQGSVLGPVLYALFVSPLFDLD